MKNSRRRYLHHEVLETRRFLHAGALAASGEPVPDFALVDQNPTSPTYDQAVSRQDFSGTTAVYFIHST